MLVSRILDPGSNLATARALSPDTASSSLGDVDDDELYAALYWLWDHREFGGQAATAVSGNELLAG